MALYESNILNSNSIMPKYLFSGGWADANLRDWGTARQSNPTINGAGIRVMCTAPSWTIYDLSLRTTNVFDLSQYNKIKVVSSGSLQSGSGGRNGIFGVGIKKASDTSTELHALGYLCNLYFAVDGNPSSLSWSDELKEITIPSSYKNENCWIYLWLTVNSYTCSYTVKELWME